MKTSILTSFVFMTSLFSGIFFSICLTSADRSTLTSSICNMINAGEPHVFADLLWNLLFLALIFLAGLSVYGFPLSFFLLYIKGVSLGFCVALIYDSDAGTLMPSLIFSGLFMAASYLTATSSAATYALTAITGVSPQRQDRLKYLQTFAMPAMLITVSVLIRVLSLRS